jgi:signal transduction histidine kinase
MTSGGAEPEYAGSVTRRNLVLDAGVAVVVLGATLGVLAAGGLGMPDPSARDLDGLAVALAGCSALPLLAWGRSPLAAYATTSAATLAMVALRYPIDFPFGPVVAVYLMAMTYSGDVRPTQRRVALAATALFVPIGAVIHLADGFELRSLLPGLTFWALMFVGVWVAGENIRLRRERIGELERQAAQREREATRERRLAAAEERTRIARELHDSAGHAINVILVQAGAARLLHERNPEASRRSITTIEEVARATIGEIDQLVRALRDDAGDDPPTPADPAAVAELLDQHRADGLSITADVRGEPRELPRNISWTAYRILQEALTNAARHGRGSAEVTLAIEPDAVDITVTNPTADRSPSRGGHGIVGMRERASLLGGALHASVDNDVFRLHAHIPCAKPVPVPSDGSTPCGGPPAATVPQGTAEARG